MAALLVSGSMWLERLAARTWDDHVLSTQPAVATSTWAGDPAARAAAGVTRIQPEIPPAEGSDSGLLGRLEVPRIGLSAAVREGVDDGTLDVSIGHVPGTARPGSPGNAGLAAHRDAEFRPLRKVRVGDEIQFLGPSGVTRYRVTWTRILPPGRVDVLRQAEAAFGLTLVTCYPFAYLGRAPLRFVVRAERISPETAGVSEVASLR